MIYYILEPYLMQIAGAVIFGGLILLTHLIYAAITKKENGEAA